jgi:hypothetical protein
MLFMNQHQITSMLILLSRLSSSTKWHAIQTCLDLTLFLFLLFYFRNNNDVHLWAFITWKD